uniref:BPTI/Kunitz inhibitor domain-containing protein n=1 Tax=Romanomermis culicivorax TaxID=13658 RepID=A0A915IFP6_ROMCU
MDVGPCTNFVERFYYSRSSRRCLGFLYGGCHGNENNFLSKHECSSFCGHHAFHGHHFHHGY